MKKILLGSVATGALVAAGSAGAADLGPRPAYKAPPMVAPVPVFSWTGCFVGAHGGYGWGRKDVRLVGESGAAGTAVDTKSGSIDTSGAIFGGQIGCDYQFAGNWVLGVQGDFAGASLNGSNDTLQASEALTVSQSLKVHTDWLSSVTVRLGFTGWLPRTLFYVRGGGAWVREHWTFIDQDLNTPDRMESSQTRSGWTIGGGLEYAIAPNWSIFAEFNHYDFGNKRVLHALGTGSHTTSLNIDAKQRIEAVRLGVNYRFDWLGKGKGKAPVVAKY